LLDDEELRSRLGVAGRERVLGRFTWKVTALGTSAEYHRLLSDLGASSSEVTEPVTTPVETSTC